MIASGDQQRGSASVNHAEFVLPQRSMASTSRPAQGMHRIKTDSEQGDRPIALYSYCSASFAVDCILHIEMPG